MPDDATIRQDALLRPIGLSHFGIQTYDVPRIRDWYCAVLNAHVVFEKSTFFCILTFDEEHHRVAIAGLPGKAKPKYGANPEYMHVAFEMRDIPSLLLNYERLRNLGIKPTVNVNHGPTLSCYYLDPDGNQCELFVDCFPTKQECTDWFFGPAYQHNFGAGIFFDPEELLVKMNAGVPLEELAPYPIEEGLKVDMAAVMDEHRRQIEAQKASFEKEMAETAG